MVVISYNDNWYDCFLKFRTPNVTMGFNTIIGFEMDDLLRMLRLPESANNGLSKHGVSPFVILGEMMVYHGI
jgi:hypothetical protein